MQDSRESDARLLEEFLEEWRVRAWRMESGQGMERLGMEGGISPEPGGLQDLH